MALISCPECGRQVSDRAVSCPDCGCPISAAPAAPAVETKSNELEKLLMLARRAKDDNNSENARKYYDMVLLNDATNWEAAFYVVYFKAMECKIAHIQSAANSVENCLSSVFQLVKEYVTNEAEQLIAATEIQLRCKLIANMLYNGADNHYRNIDSSIRSNYLQEVVDKTCAARDIMYTCGDEIDNNFGGQPGFGVLAAAAWKEGIRMHRDIMPRLSNQEINEQVIGSYTTKIGQYDAEYQRAYEQKQEAEKLSNELSSLQSKVRTLENTINNTKTTRSFNCIGWFLVICGGIMTMLGMTLLSMDEDQSWALIVGIVELVLAFLVGRDSQSTVETNRRAVENARAELPKAKEALEAFRKAHPEVR